MKSTICAVLLIVGFAAFANGNEDNDNWPCYMKKCGKNDPNLSTCMLHHANRALNTLFAGDEKIGIPNYIPYNLPSFELGRKRTFKIHINNAKLVGMQNLHVETIEWNFELKSLDIKFLFNSAVYIDGDYVSTGKFNNRSIAGDGHADLIFVGGSDGGNLTYSMKYDLLKVLGKEYVQIQSRECTRSEGLRVEFTNKLISKKQAETDRVYLNEHSDEFNAALSDEMQELICELVDQSLNPVFYNFPLETMFDKN